MTDVQTDAQRLAANMRRVADLAEQDADVAWVLLNTPLPWYEAEGAAAQRRFFREAAPTEQH